MKTFAINTLGCKVNQYESQQIRQFVEQFGLKLVPKAEKADLVLVHTCCITHTASAKSRRHIRKTQRLNPQAVIVASGCLPKAATGETKGLDEAVHLAEDFEALSSTLTRILGANAALKLSKRQTLSSYVGQTRAFLKIQDGCDGYCTYCIVPQARPKITSKPAEIVLAEAQDLAKAGHKEIVLTGIFLGAYGQNTVRRGKWESKQKDCLAGLLVKLAQLPELKRVRLSSLEPADVTAKLLEVLSERSTIMPHLHLPLQSGSASILKKMCRQYTIDDFRKTIEAVKSHLDRPAITTDIIVGFPGETDADFAATVEMAKEVGFAKMHVFSFSPRKGTAAEKMEPKVNNEIIKERSSFLQKLDKQLAQKFRSQFTGEKVGIIIEDEKKKIGRCERYFEVQMHGPEKVRKGDLIYGRIDEQNRSWLLPQAALIAAQ